MALDRQLLRLLVAPAHPHAVPLPGDWARVESVIDRKIPDDHKALLATYGCGSIDDFVLLLSPAASNPNLNFLVQAQRQADVLRAIRKDWPEEVPFSLFPEPGGLLLWGLTDNGNALFWMTEKKRGPWPIIVTESRGPRWERFDLSVSLLLLSLLSRTRRCKVFPEDFPSDQPTFASFVRA